jgi:simple sugar transport system permease protein
MMNYIAIKLVDYLVKQVLRDPTASMDRTPSILSTAALPHLFGPATRLHAGLLIALAAVVLVAWLLDKTTLGFEIQTVGINPAAAQYAGMQVARTLVCTMALSGMLAGLAGAYFTLESVPHFEPLMTNGRGFIALAAMIFGKWTPLGAWAAALLFGVAEAIPTALQLQGISVPFQLVGLLPYLLTIVVVAGAVGRASPPAAVGVPYERS